MFVLYIANYLDRVNVSFAALHMNRDLGFSGAAYGLGRGLPGRDSRRGRRRRSALGRLARPERRRWPRGLAMALPARRIALGATRRGCVVVPDRPAGRRPLAPRRGTRLARGTAAPGPV